MSNDDLIFHTPKNLNKPTQIKTQQKKRILSCYTYSNFFLNLNLD